jgi:hypothetical protein
MCLVTGLVLFSCSRPPASARVESPPPASARVDSPAEPPQPAPSARQPEPVVLAAGLHLRNHVALAVDGANVYFGGSDETQLMKVPSGGGTPVVHASASQIGAIRLDAVNVYWADVDKIMKAPLAGGKATTLATDSRHVIGDLAVDATSVYWASWDNTSARVMKVPIAGGKASALATSRQHPSSLVAGSGGVYWTSWGADSSISDTIGGDGAITRAPTRGGPPVELASLQPGPHYLAVDATSVYWNNVGPKSRPGLMKAPIAGGTVTTMAAPIHATDLAVDGARLYWTDYEAGAVMSVSIDGGTPTVVADRQRDPNAIALDGTSIYWANLGDGGAILKVAKP